jgi:hypothetical protein
MRNWRARWARHDRACSMNRAPENDSFEDSLPERVEFELSIDLVERYRLWQNRFDIMSSAPPKAASQSASWKYLTLLDGLLATYEVA